MTRQKNPIFSSPPFGSSFTLECADMGPRREARDSFCFCLGEELEHSFYRKEQRERSVIKRSETIFLIESLRILVESIDHDGKHRNVLVDTRASYQCVHQQL